MSGQSLYQQLQQNSALNGANATYIEDLFEQYQLDNNSVEPEWQQYFSSLQDNAAVSLGEVKERFAQLGKHPVFASSASSESVIEHKQLEIANLINSYRALGHRQAKIDPLDLQVHPEVPELTLKYHGLTDSDLNTEFDAGEVSGLKRASLQQIVTTLKETYCDSIGAEVMQIADTTKREWLLKRFEVIKGKPGLPKNEQLRILEKLAATDGLEKYLGTKYVGQKRFSIEGADSIIPMMDALTLEGAKKGVQEIVVGMAHRGRLNMLINFLGKAPADLFDEFEGKKDNDRSGDVKYHKGFSSNVTTPDGMVHLAMAYNPSHLEIVDPVVEGSVRAKQWRRGDEERQEVLPVLLHGDAAFSSQGVIQETFNMSQVPGYTAGGTIHIVLNNQVGFTTPAEQGRSTLYCTDIAKMIDAPIFHVNGDDPEACVFALKLLYEYRYTFKCDVVIDLVCYRRHGHQEVDEPSMTQPLMYKVIKKHLTTDKIYAQQLEQAGVIQPGDLTKIEKAYRKALDNGQAVVELDEKTKRNAKHKFSVDWKSYDVSDWRHATKTSLPKKEVESLATKCITLLEKFALQPQVAKIITNRKKMAAGEISFDWGFAETLAYASLLIEGYPVRISGEDVQRGTFGHRHAVLHDFEDGDVYIPLRHLAKKQANIWIYNSILSEEGVLGFEVGYAAAAPDTLVIWEAQFGDFANGAQVLVDQFLSSGEQKWGQKSGLALFLPHGYEGQGPEHSSARLERYLQLCAQHNMQVCVPTTPAQVFHMLRRQMLRKMRIPLIVMTPKSMLRAPLAVSPLADFTHGNFQPVIDEIDKDIKAANVKRVLLCCGKIYYDLFMQRRENKQTDVAIIRVEQLYPFPQEELAKMIQQYPAASDVVWVQEEPRNQGAWYFMQHHMLESVNDKQDLTCVSREASAAPAGGYMSTHMDRQKKVVAEALNFES